MENEYNDLPVTYCSHCKSLHIVTDHNDNEICYSCGAINETDTLPTIEEYIELYGEEDLV